MDEFVGGMMCGGLLCFGLPLVLSIVAFVRARSASNAVAQLQKEQADLSREMVGLRAQMGALAARTVRSAPDVRPGVGVAADAVVGTSGASASSSIAAVTSLPLAESAPTAPAVPAAVSAAVPAAVPAAASATPSPASPAAAPPVPDDIAALLGRPPPKPPRPPAPPFVPPPPFDLAAFIEQNAVWAFAAVGGVLMVVAALFAFREAVALGFLGPGARFALGIVVGVTSWGLGEILRARRYPTVSAALGGVGAGILYAALWAGHARYGIVGQGTTFGAMFVVSAVTMFVAERRNSLFMAVLGAIGAYMTPILLSTGENKAVAFFAYLAVVNVGLLVASWRRSWAVIVGLSGLVTTVLYLGWALQFRAPDQVPVGLLAPALLALAFFALVPTAPTYVAVAALAAGALLWTVGGLSYTTPTDLGRVDPVSGMALTADYRVTAWLGLAYLLTGALVLPRMVRRWMPAQVGVVAAVAVVMVAYAGSWSFVDFPAEVPVAVAIVAVPALVLAAGFDLGAVGFVGLAGIIGVVTQAGTDRGVGVINGTALGLAAISLVIGFLRGYRFALPIGILAAGLQVYPSLVPVAKPDTLSLLLAAAPIYVAYAFGPFVRPKSSDLGGVLGSVLAGGIYFWPFLSLWKMHLGTQFPGLLAVVLGMNALLGAVALVRVARARNDSQELALMAVTVMLFAAMAVPIQLDKAWLTVGWAIEVAALGWLSRHVKHRGLVVFAVFLAVVVNVRLLLNPAALSYHGGEGPILLNWTLYTWGVPAACMLIAAHFLENTAIKGMLRTSAVLLGFALLNLEIAHAFAHDNALSFRSENLREEMTRSISWGAYGLALIVLGVANGSRGARLAGLVIAVLGASKVCLVDMWSLSGFWRVGALAGIAVTLLAAGAAFQKLVRDRK